MVSITKGSQEGRRSMKRRDEEKSTTQEENHNKFSHISYILLLLIFPSLIFHDFLLLLSRTFYLVPQYSFAYSADLFLSI